MTNPEPWIGNTVEEYVKDGCVATFVADSAKEMSNCVHQYLMKYSPAQYGTVFLKKPYEEKDGAWHAQTHRFAKAAR